jgi:hypothetical protein
MEELPYAKSEFCVCVCVQHFVFWPNLPYILCRVSLKTAIMQNNNLRINSSLYSLV